MNTGDKINGYTLLRDFTTTGGGQCQWSFAEKGGEQYFIKQFLFPTYPIEGSPGSSKTKALKLTQCEKFETYHKKLQSVLSGKCSKGSNLIVTRDFFREKAKYYKTTDKVDISAESISSISKLAFPKRMLILKTIAHSLQILHHENIVHGDLKPDNILIKETKPGILFTTKLIDFDNSYFAGNPFEVFDEIVGDMTYYSPELALFFQKDDSIKPDMLQTKSDIFSLGIIFFQYLTGNMPFSKEKNKFPYVAILNNETLAFPIGLPEQLKELLIQMMHKNFEKRPNIGEVFSELKEINIEELEPIVGSKIRGKNLNEMLEESEKIIGKEEKGTVLPVAGSGLRGKNLDELRIGTKKGDK
ncbi:hypothetical protein FACS1894142_0600 [Spirochaetia bacterium]|nr:hypothetical protein FACS1894142_0600 [Spirochaetia bacterium]